MGRQGDAYDMVVGDSQWLGQGAEQGHYMELTDFMKSNGIDTTVTPATLKYYGEFPANSGRYWAYPTEGDAVGWAYRKDRFEDPAEMAAFEAKYGYPLAVPEPGCSCGILPNSSIAQTKTSTVSASTPN